jgi:hypothetical protein
MASGDIEVLTGRLQRGDAELAGVVEFQVRDGQSVTFSVPKGTIVVGEMLRLHFVDRNIEFVVNSETPSESSGVDATYDGRILKDSAVSPQARTE